jgi:hypothetical protein
MIQHRNISSLASVILVKQAWYRCRESQNTAVQPPQEQQTIHCPISHPSLITYPLSPIPFRTQVNKPSHARGTPTAILSTLLA